MLMWSSGLQFSNCNLQLYILWSDARNILVVLDHIKNSISLILFFFFCYLDSLYLICWTCVYNIDISVDVSLFYFFLLPSAWTERKAPAAHRQRCNYQNFHPFNPAVCLIRSLMLFISVFFVCLFLAHTTRSFRDQDVQRTQTSNYVPGHHSRWQVHLFCCQRLLHH